MDKFYFGSRTSSNRIDILDGYFTSSKIVKQLIEIYGLETFSIVEYKLFDTAYEAIKYEDEYLSSISNKCAYLNVNFSAGGAVIKSQTHNRIYNEKTNVYMYYPKELGIPFGWVKKAKNPPPSRSGLRKYINIHTKEIKFSKPNELSSDYVLYTNYLNDNKPPRKNIFITNGITNTKIAEGESLPDGWILGKTVKFTKHSVTNGVESRYIDKNDPIPEGWWRGSHNERPKTKGMIKITNGFDNKLIDRTDTIPDGWYRGSSSSGKYVYVYNDILFHRKKDLIEYLNLTPTKFDLMVKKNQFGNLLNIIDKYKYKQNNI